MRLKRTIWLTYLIVVVWFVMFENLTKVHGSMYQTIAFVYTLFGLALILYGLKSFNAQPSIFMVAILFCISYINRLQQLLMPNSFFNLGGDRSTGNFIYSVSNIFDFTLYTTFAMFCVIAGIRLIRKSGKRKKENINIFHVNEMRLVKIFYCILLIRFVILLVAYQFNIGISGTVPYSLPLKITGIINFLNSILLPIFSVYLLLLIFCNDLKVSRRFIYCGLALILFALVSASVSKSKASLMFVLIPVFLVMLNTRLCPKQKSMFVKMTICLSTIAMLLVYITVEYVRSQDDSTFLDFDSIVNYIDNYKLSNDDLNSITVFVNSFLARFNGGSEFMAVMSSHQTYDYVLLKLFASTDYLLNDLPLLIEEVYGVKVGVYGDTFTGKGMGFFATVFLSHDIYTFFSCSLLLGIFIGAAERLINRYGNTIISIILTFYIVLNLWEGGYDVFFLYVAAVPLLICFANYISKSACHYKSNV